MIRGLSILKDVPMSCHDLSRAHDSFCWTEPIMGDLTQGSPVHASPEGRIGRRRLIINPLALEPEQTPEIPEYLLACFGAGSGMD